MQESVSGKVAGVIGEMTDEGVRSKIDSTKQQIEAYKQIADYQDQITKELTDRGLDNPDVIGLDRERVLNAQKNLDLLRQITPEMFKQQEILKANAVIEKSVAFKATESSLTKTLDKYTNGGIDKMLGTNKKGGGSEIAQLFGDVLKAQTGENNKSMATKFTDKLFGIKTVDKNAELAASYKAWADAEVQSAKESAGIMSKSNSNATIVMDAGKLSMSAAKTFDGAVSKLTSAIGAPSDSMKYDIASGASDVKANAAVIAKSSGNVVASGSSGNTGSPNSAGNVAVTNSASSPGATPKTMTRAEINQASLGRVGRGISGISSAISGYEQGGISGGLQTGMGISSLISAIAPHFGPAGIAISVVAGLVSALSHHDDPAKMADKYNTVPYGQGLADLTGKSAGANGTTFTTSASVYDQTNGKGQLGYIEQILSKGKPGYMSQAQYDSLVKEFGISATGAGSVEHGKNIGQERITGASGTDGQFRSYTQLNADATSALSQIQSKIGQTLAPIISMNAYGAGPGYKGNPNNMIGLSAQEMALTTKARLYGINSSQQGNSIVDPQYQQSPYATPGVGGQAPGSNASNPVYTAPANGNQMIKLTTNLVVSGQVLATIVNAVNAQTANKNGTAPA